MHFTSMPDAQHQYVKFSVVYVVDDPVIADPNPKFPVTAPELNTPLWTRFLGQLTDRSQQPPRYGLIKLAQLLRRR